MLKCPTEVTPELGHLFNYQLMVLNSIRMRDEQLEATNNEVGGVPIIPMHELRGAYRQMMCWNGFII